MSDAQLTELRLPAFKSVRDAVIPINPLTLIVGRNGSGKSNILDEAALLIDRLKRTAAERQIRTVATTHSPAVLDALTG